MIPYFPDSIQTWDIEVLNAIQEKIACPFLDKLFPYITLFAEGGIFWIALAVIFLFFKKTRKTGIMMGAALILGLIFVNVVIKNLVGRVRPYDLEGALVTLDNLLIKKQSDYSFPSGHSLACFECATVLTYKYKFKAIPAVIIALAVSFSRLYLYVHFPTDVICGAIFGIINGILAIIIVKAVYKAIEKKKGLKLPD